MLQHQYDCSKNPNHLVFKEKNDMKKLNKLLICLSLLGSLLITSCLKDNDTNPDIPHATMRLVNAYTGSESLVFTDGTNYLSDPYYPLKYNTYTINPIYLFPGNRQIKVYDQNKNLIVESTVELKDSTSFTSFVFGKKEDAKNLITIDKGIKDLGNKSGIRFFHLANDLENVKVYFNSLEELIYPDVAPVLENYANELYDFTPQLAGKHKIIVTDMENNNLIEREFTFNKGAYYSIILTGNRDSSNNKPLYIGVVQQ